MKTKTYKPMTPQERWLKTVGKNTFVILSGKAPKNQIPCLKKMTFPDKETGLPRLYSAKTVGYKTVAWRHLVSNGLVPKILLDIYQYPSRLNIKIRKKAGRYYKKLIPGAKLPPMIIKKQKNKIFSVKISKKTNSII